FVRFSVEYRPTAARHPVVSRHRSIHSEKRVSYAPLHDARARMNRHSIRSLSLAAVCGAVATCLVSSVLDTHFARGPQAVRPTAGREPRLPARRVPALDEQRPPGVEDVLAIYEIAAAAGRRELDGLLRDAASRTRSPAQRLLLHALLTR